MANTFHLSISTPSIETISEEVSQVTLPTQFGMTGILANHAKIVGVLKPGKVHITTSSGKDEYGFVNQGVYSFNDNRMIILSDYYKAGNEQVDTNYFDDLQKQLEEGMKDADLTENAKKAMFTYIRKVIVKAKEASKKR